MDPMIKKLRAQYDDIPIPLELEQRVKHTLNQTLSAHEREPQGIQRRRGVKGVLVTAASLAAALAIFTAGINLSPAFAQRLEAMPLIGSLVKVLLLREYTYQEDSYQANLKVPGIEGLKNEAFASGLNEKYVEENRALYVAFMEDMASLKEAGGGHMGVASGYEVFTDTERLLSIGRYVVNTVGSSSTIYKYDTIDKVNEVLITLPSLFTDDRYVEVISAEIKRQMVEQHKADPNHFYWVEGIEQSASMPLFERIARDQSFYISAEGKLIISFDKYEVAPGYMGVVTFTIPTEVLMDYVVSQDYLK